MTLHRSTLVLGAACLLWAAGCGSDPKPRKDAAAPTDAAGTDAPVDRVPADTASDRFDAEDALGGDVPNGDVGDTAVAPDTAIAPDTATPDGPTQDTSDGAQSDGGDGGDGAGGADGGADAVETGGTGGIGGGFYSVPPCLTPDTYSSGATVTFLHNDARYSPKCLRIPRGGSVTFIADGGTFADHTLRPSVKRGDRLNNPIMRTETGTTATFTFPTPGFFAYFCALHGFSDTGSGTMMDGVVWVE